MNRTAPTAVTLVLALFATGVALAQDSSLEAAPNRFARLLDPAVRAGSLSKERAAALESLWSDVRVGDLPKDVAFEDGLVSLSVSKGWLSPAEAATISSDTTAAVVALADEHEGVSWFQKFVSLLPWVGGVALAGGAIALLAKWFGDLNHGLQTIGAACVTALLLWGAWRLGPSWAKTVEVLGLAGALGILGTKVLLLVWMDASPSARSVAAILSVAWGAVACVLDASVVAAFSAGAVAYVVGAESAFRLIGEEKNAGSRTLALVGGSLVGIGYALLHVAPHAHASLLSLVRPYWSVGVLGLLVSAGVAWDWQEWFAPSRAWAFAVGVACLAWGTIGHEGVFVGAGSLAVAAWAYATLWDTASRVVSTSACVLLVGVLTLGIAAGLDRQWPLVVSLLTAKSF